MEKQNWANIESDEDDDYEQERRESQQQESQEERTEQQTTESRPPGVGQGQRDNRDNRGQYGNRGPRGSGRGGGRGRGGNSRGGRQDRPQKPQRENQTEEEMMSFVKRSHDKNVFINLFNVDYNVKDEDIRGFYNDVSITNIEQLNQGLFLVELEKNEALKMIELGTGDLKGRTFYMRMGYSNKQQNPDDQWHHVNSGNHQRDLPRHQDRDKRGGYGKPYNRREQGDYQHDDGFKKPYIKQFRNRDDAPKEDAPIDTNNKFFKDLDPSNTEFKPRFMNSKAKQPSEGTSTSQAEGTGDNQPKVNKSNPFGAAVARNEQEYLKKKEEEKGQVQDLKENFEEKKEEVAQDTNISPSNTPVDAEQTQPKSQGPPGFSNNKKFTNKNKPEKPAAPETKQPVIVQPTPQQQPKAGEKGKKGDSKKTNIFDLLND